MSRHTRLANLALRICKGLLLAGIVLTGNSVLAQDVAAERVPAFLTGTWNLVMQNSTGASPYPNDTEFELTFAIDGSICDEGLRIKGAYYPGGNISSLT